MAANSRALLLLAALTFLLSVLATTEEGARRPSIRSALEQEAAAGSLAKRLALVAVRHQRAASQAKWRSSVVVVVTWHSRDIDWLSQYGFERSGITVALYIKGGNHTCNSVPQSLLATVAHCEKGDNAEGREAHTMGLFLAQWYTALPRVTVFVHDNEEPRLAQFRGMKASQLRAWVHNVESQPSPIFRNSSTCMCAHAREINWLSYGHRKQPMVWFMQHVLGFTDADTRWQSLTFPPGAVLAVPSRAVLTRPRLVYELIYALTNGTERGQCGQCPGGFQPDVWAPQLTYHGWQDGIQRKWAPFSWAHNFERLWVRFAS